MNESETPTEIERLRQVKTRLDAVSPSLCAAKWTQATLHLFNGNTQSCHHVLPHRVDLAEVKLDPAALHNSSKKKLVRAQMQKGTRPKECSYCWNVEKVGELSDRVHKSAATWSESFLRELPAAPSATPKNLEVAFDNTCNFKCAYCSPVYSSTWEAEIRRYGAYPTTMGYNGLRQFERQETSPLPEITRADYRDAFWNWWPELAASLEHIRVTGGEPLLSGGLWRLLDDLIETPRPHLTLAVNSNLSGPARLIDRLLEKFAALDGKVRVFNFFTSIDCLGPAAEFIRHGLDFATFEANVRRILNESTVPLHFGFMITVNNLSLPGLPGLLSWIAQLRREFPRHTLPVDTPYLQNPRHLSVRLLPQEFARYVDDSVAVMDRENFSATEKQRLYRIGELIRLEPFPRWQKSLLRRDLMAFLREHDRRRATNFRSVFNGSHGDFFDSLDNGGWLIAP